MIKKEIIENIITLTISEIIPNKQIKSFDEDFISINSKLESIEIAQIIARIEELIEEKGIEGFDLFEKVFECDQVSFNSLSDLIYHHLK